MFTAALVGCDSDPAPMSPDAAPPPTTVPRDPAGQFVVATTLDLEPPRAATIVIEALDRAASEPSRFVLDRMIATLPDGPTKTVAQLAVPYVAAYLDVRLDAFAPRFVPGVQALATGFARIASHAELLEAWRIMPSGDAVRTIAGVRFDLGPSAIIAFADHGLADVSAATQVTLDGGGQLGFAHHVIALRYGALVRAGLDLAVVPTAEPTAHDVAAALATLVDCTKLGVLVADRVGLGSPLVYRTACTAAMVAVAAELDEHVIAIDAAPLMLDTVGLAVGADLDHDGTMDVIRGGRWTGVAAHVGVPQPISATFAGGSPP
ncbi:MAG: hypothetical protein IPQ07_06425 [Myxococcales bacterium]|nr:hypothetical protein [Myxococcales bacterium]